MKRIVSLCTLCVVLMACQQDDLDADGRGQTRLTLNLNAVESLIESRAVSSDQEEQIIHNVYVFIFNQDGSKAFSKLYADINVANSTTLAAITSIPAGAAKTIVALANIDNSIVDVTATELDKITTKTQLEALTSRIKGTFVERGTSFLMCGMLENVTLAGSANTITIPMHRIDAKIRFNITTPTGVTFTPQDWRVVAVPKTVSVLPNTKTDQCPVADYFTTQWYNFEVQKTPGENTFAFYVMENKVSSLEDIPATGTPEEQYALREKRNKTAEGKDLTFRYARPTATYVELRGNLQYSSGGTTPISADVVYTIHLGAVGGAVNDYNSLRNTFYTYKVTIKSVDKILTEVSTGVEGRPGAEGDVVLAQSITRCDAYNEVLSFPFNQAVIDAGLTWQVITPFSNGAEEAGAPLPTDYEWIHFNICNKTGGVYSPDFVPYSGDQKVYSNAELDPTNPVATLTKYMADIGTPNQKMLNVRQLLAILKQSKVAYDAKGSHLFDTNGNIRVTAYLNDYYYETNPNDPSETVQNGLWKKFVNEKERMINILSRLTHSKDGKSSKSEAFLSIRQASIQTMYNKFLTGTNFTAWGLQMIQDTKQLPFDTASDTKVYPDPSNGRLNSINMWLATPHNWSDYIEPKTWQMKPAYEVAKYKCLRQNRDMNGDGRIDEAEVQWCLASINQLTDMWIGESSYNNDARLYTLTTWNQSHWYVSSTVTAGHSNDPEILWSAEGSSVGRLEGKSTLYYRCVRNLGLDPKAAKGVMPDDFATYDATTHTMNLDKLDEKSIRGFSTVGELSDHTERDVRGYNKPWKQFKVHTETHGTNLTWEQIRTRSQPNGATPVCPQGWRVPNQRELSLMYSRMPRNSTTWPLSNQFSRTGFTFATNDRPGFAVSQSGLTFFLLNGAGTSGGVRCVQDVIR
ncbi:MAG: FimB/Mfa2 family fimbrial subunit [Alistipes sp.]